MLSRKPIISGCGFLLPHQLIDNCWDTEISAQLRNMKADGKPRSWSKKKNFFDQTRFENFLYHTTKVFWATCTLPQTMVENFPSLFCALHNTNSSDALVISLGSLWHQISFANASWLQHQEECKLQYKGILEYWKVENFRSRCTLQDSKSFLKHCYCITTSRYLLSKAFQYIHAYLITKRGFFSTTWSWSQALCIVLSSAMKKRKERR